jgi:ribosomal protein S18 acetylase RimI-like enzyme
MQATDLDVTIREFRPGDETTFRQLNEEWIIRYFSMEREDEELLAHPRRMILDHGGRIFFAVRDGKTIGCCALRAMGEGEYEVSKMAVTESAQGGGIGRRLMDAVIAAAREIGAARLVLETNSKLAPAIRLYESVGFQHVARRASPYARAEVFMAMELGGLKSAAD